MDYLSLSRQLNQIIKNKVHIILRNKRTKYEIVNKNHIIIQNKNIKSGMIKQKSERTKETSTCYFQTKKGENTSSTYNREEKKKNKL